MGPFSEEHAGQRRRPGAIDSTWNEKNHPPCQHTLLLHMAHSQHVVWGGLGVVWGWLGVVWGWLGVVWGGLGVKHICELEPSICELVRPSLRFGDHDRTFGGSVPRPRPPPAQPTPDHSQTTPDRSQHVNHVGTHT